MASVAAAPLVSVLIPVAVGGEFLFESVGSVLGQTMKDWEILIGVNGLGLTEGALEVADALAFADPRIRVVRQDAAKIRSKVASLNDLVGKARGSWIALLDADDRWAPNKLQRQMEAANGPARTAAVIGTWCKYFGDHVGSPVLPTGFIAPSFLGRVNPIINSSTLIRREWAWWRDVALEDYDLWMRVALHGGALYNVPAVLVDHRIHARSTFNSQHISPDALQAWFRRSISAVPIRILTTVCNNPEYIELQLITLRRHVAVPFEFIVFNDAKAWADATNFGDAGVREAIAAICARLGVRCIPVANEAHRHVLSASQRHCDTLRVVMDFVRAEKGRYWMLDSDMFLVRDIDADAYFTDGAAVVLQTRRDGVRRYAWPNLWWIDVGAVDVSGLSWDLAPDCDTGGASAVWLAGLRSRRWIQHLPSCTWDRAALSGLSGLSDLFCQDALLAFLEGDVRNQEGRFWAELYEGAILHLRAGSNWNGEGRAVHAELLRRLRTYLTGREARTVVGQTVGSTGAPGWSWNA